MNRRGFLGSIIALGAAPAIVRADSLMRIVPRGALVMGADACCTHWDDATVYTFYEEVPDQSVVYQRIDPEQAIREIQRTLVALGIWQGPMP